jgi:hypothetical protein
MHPPTTATRPPTWRRLLQPLAGWWTRRGTEPVAFRLLGHLEDLGVAVETARRHGKPVRRREGKIRLTHWLLARLEVGLPRIRTIEVWRVVTRSRDGTSVLEEITFLAPIGPGRDMTRLPILTNAAASPVAGGGREIVWRGFEWGRLPLLRDHLTADGELNRRLLGRADGELSGGLRITANSGNRVGVTTTFDRHCLPSADFLDCIDRIFGHVDDYLAERNLAREAEGRGRPRRGR